MNKIVLVNWQGKIDDKKVIESMSEIGYLLPDIDIYNAIKSNDINLSEKIKTKFENVFVLNSDLEKVGKDRFPKLDMEHIYSKYTDGMVVSARDYYYLSDTRQKYSPSTIINTLLSQNKKVFYIVSETGLNYFNNKSGKNIFEKMNRDLLEISKSKLENLIIIYKPMFISDKITVTNKHIDDVVMLIRSFMNSTFNYQCPILISCNVTNSNVLSFCVTNNFDGFVVDANEKDVNDVVDIIRKVHGWQRIVKNQIMRRKKLS